MCVNSIKQKPTTVPIAPMSYFTMLILLLQLFIRMPRLLVQELLVCLQICHLQLASNAMKGYTYVLFQLKPILLLVSTAMVVVTVTVSTAMITTNTAAAAAATLAF